MKKLSTYRNHLNWNNLNGLLFISLFYFSGICIVEGQVTISGVSPGKGPIGTSVTVTGSGFNTSAGNNIVYFGAAKASVSSSSATQLSAVAPIGSNFRDLTVTNLSSGLTGFSGKPFINTYNIAGSLSFTNSYISMNGGQPNTMAIGDFDGDGKMDLLCANYGYTSVEIRRNLSSASSLVFNSAQSFPLANQTYSLEVSDIDGDGKLDILACQNGDGIAILRNTSSGVGSISFATYTIVSSGIGGPGRVISADLDNDGKPEMIVCGNGGSGSSAIAVLRNLSSPGSISYGAASLIATLTGNNRIVAGDIDGDGKKDLILTYYGGTGNSFVSLFRNISSGAGSISFASRFDLQSVPGQPAFDLAVADLDGDGLNDIVNICGLTTVACFRNTSSIGSFSFAARQDFPGNGSYTAPSVGLGDLNGDGKVDLLCTSGAPDAVAYFQNNSSSGSIVLASKINYYDGGWPNAPCVSDFDGDGKADVAVGAYQSSSIGIMSNSSAIALPPPTLSFITLNSESDIKNDGQLLIANNLGAGAQSVQVNGVCFGNSASGLSNFANGGGAFCSDCPAGSAFKKLFDGLVFQPNGSQSSIAISGLIPSHLYRIQLLLSNDINSTGNNMQVSVAGQTFSLSNWIPNTKDAIIEFYASSSSISILFLANSGAEPNRAIVNAYAVHDLSLPTALCNRPPVANAGADQSIGASSGCSVSFVLDGSASSDPDGGSLSYQWYDGSSLIGSSSSISLSAGLGHHVYSLVVSDSWGSGSSDQVSVDIYDRQTPIAVCRNISVDLNALGQAQIKASDVDAGSGDACGSVSISIDKTDFDCSDVGANSVILTVTDASGNSSSCTAIVSIYDHQSPTIGSVRGNPFPSVTSSQPNVFAKNAGVWHGPSPYNHLMVAHADFDGDGDQDLLYTTNNSTLVYKNDGLGVMTSSQQLFGVISNCVAAGDLNGDGKADAVLGVWGDPSNKKCRIYLNDGSGHLGLSVSNMGGNDRINDVKLADLDGDGDLDIFFVGSGYNNRSHKVWFNNGAGSFTESSQSFNDAWGQRVVLGDFDGNGTIDAFVTADYPVNSSMLWLNNGSGIFTASSQTFKEGYGIDAADIDNDGDLDIAYAIYEGNQVLMLKNNGSGGFTATGQNFSVPSDKGAYSLRFSDLDLDGDKDLVVGFGSYLQNPVIWNNDGTGHFDLGNEIPLEYSWSTSDIIFPDMDNDGDADFVNANAGSYNEVLFNQIKHPVVGGTADITVNNADGQCGNNVSYAHSATDNCSASVSYSIASGNFFPVGSTTVVATAIDASGNSSSSSFHVIVKDVELPKIVCPADIEVYATGADGAVVYYDTPVGRDNCASSTIRTAGLASGATFPRGTTVVTHQVTDASGNIAQCSFRVSVTGRPPEIVCPSDIIAHTEAGLCGAKVDYAASETVGIPASTITYSIEPGSYFEVGSVIVTATARNEIGSSSCSFRVSVEDHEAPIAVCKNISIELDASGAASISAADIDGGSSDACSIASLAIDKSSFDCSSVGDNQVILSVTDVHGNSSSCAAIVKVADHIAPIAVCKNISIELDASGAASISAADVDGGSSDACGIASLAIDKSSFDCSSVGDNEVILSVTDVHGNSSSCAAIVKVADHVAPIAICKNISIELDALGHAYIAAADIDGGSSDACGIASLSISKSDFDCSNVGSNQVSLTVIDKYGNSSACVAIVKVFDHVAPIVKVKEISITLSGGSASYSAQQLDNGSSDACGIASYSASPTRFSCADIGDHAVVLTVTDVHGNSSSAVTTVHVLGSIPSISFSPLPQTSPSQPNTIFIGYGSTGLSLNAIASGGSGFTYSWAPNASLSSTTIANPVASPKQTTTYYLTVTNSNGCSASASITICVLDVRSVSKGAYDGKVLVCHYPPGNPTNTQLLSISSNAVKAHIDHGCRIGACNAVCSVTAARGEEQDEHVTLDLSSGQLQTSAFPNPFKDQISFYFSVPKAGNATLELYTIGGALIATPFHSYTDKNITHEVLFDGSKLAEGMYFYKLTTEDGLIDIKKVVLAK